MPHPPWWTTLTAAELLRLRQRLIEHIRAEFPGRLEIDPEDLVHHAFTVLFERRHRVKPERDGLFRYLTTVARNAGLDQVRRLGRSGTPRTLQGPIEAPDSTENADAADEQTKIWQIFCALGDLERLIVWSHVVEKQPVRAIARELDLNWHRVARTIDSALRRIRRELNR
jgi:RNA polymerase sigma factor (sigma-70 family)